MEIFRIYEHLIGEEEVAQKAESCVRAFGDELFANQLDGIEPNTPFEEKIATDIYNFTSGSHHGRNLSAKLPTFIAKMKTLQNCMSSYLEVLYPEGVVYRGLNRKLNSLIGLYQKSHGKVNFKLPYVANNYIQSWSESREKAISTFTNPYFSNTLINQMADELEGKSIKDKYYPNQTIDTLIAELKEYISVDIGFILSHNATPDSFLFKAKYFSKLSKYTNESEVLRLGKDPLMCTWALVIPEIFTVVLPFMIK